MRALNYLYCCIYTVREILHLLSSTESAYNNCIILMKVTRNHQNQHRGHHNCLYRLCEIPSLHCPEPPSLSSSLYEVAEREGGREEFGDGGGDLAAAYTFSFCFSVAMAPITLLSLRRSSTSTEDREKDAKVTFFSCYDNSQGVQMDRKRPSRNEV